MDYGNFDISKFSALVKNLGTSSAAMQLDKTKIDTKAELNTYASGWDAIQAKAQSEGAAAADLTSLEGIMKSELASLMGAEFGNTAGVKQNDKGVFSEEDISLKNMMTALQYVDGFDMDKLREHIKKPLNTNPTDMDILTNAGFDPELLEILMDETPSAISDIIDAIKNNPESQERIEKSVLTAANGTETPEQYDTYMLLLQDASIT